MLIHVLMEYIYSAITQKHSSHVDLEAFWLQAWRLAARLVTNSATCRSACHLTMVLLNVGFVQYEAISDVASGIISSYELHGPSDCVDSATTLMSILIICMGRSRLGYKSETSEQALNWLLNRWSPSKTSSPVYVSSTDS